MLSLPKVVLDIRGTNPANLISGERIALADKELKYLIPDGSPFFAEEASTILYNAQGGELRLNQDYFFEEEFQPLCKATGRSVCCFIRLTDAVVNNNEFVTLGYRSVGAYFVPRSKLQEWLAVIQDNGLIIPWAKVFGVPPTLPAEYHIQNAKTEIADWFEFTDFFVQWNGLANAVDSSANESVSTDVNSAFALLKQTKDQQLDRLNVHDKNYSNPHGIAKDDIDLENLDNYPTATLQEDLDGIRSDRFSTPMGIQELAKVIAPDTNELMRQGILPISKFSTDSYIPPAILGSFEGLGSRSEVMGMCKEVDGRVVAIQNHFDGRAEGLYYSTLTDYNKPFDPANPYRFDYTAYKYEPPVLSALGVTPNAIVMGSGNEIIMVGKTTQGNPAANDRWFLALTGNSFDPGSHLYVEVSMANVFAQCGNPDALGRWGQYLYHGRMSVSLLGNWVVLAVECGAGLFLAGQGRLSYWKVPKQALIDGLPLNWTNLHLTYRDYDNILRVDLPYWEYAQKVINGPNVSKWGRYNFTPIEPPAGVGYLGRRFLSLFAEKPGATDVVYLNIMAWVFLHYTPSGAGQITAYDVMNMVYELNLVTGAMTVVFKQAPVNVDYTGPGPGAEIQAELDKAMLWYDPLVSYMYPATVILPNGEMLTSRAAHGHEAALLNSVIEYRQLKEVSTGQPITSRADLLKDSLLLSRIDNNKLYIKFRSIEPPIPVGLSSCQVAYETTGENFITKPTVVEDFTVGPVNPRVVCRNVSGGFAIRPEIYNQDLSPVYSRPLTNDVYNTNMTVRESVVSITGEENILNAAGVECGTMGLSVCGWSSGRDHSGLGTGPQPVAPSPSVAFRSPDETGAFLTFPKTYTRVLDAATQVMNYTPTAFYGISEAVKNKIRSLIPVEKRGDYWVFSWFMLNGETGGMFQGLNNAVLYVKYPTAPDNSDNTWDAQVFYVSHDIEAPNAGHPGCHLITDFNVLGSSVPYIQHRGLSSIYFGASTTNGSRGELKVYREPNTLKCSLYSGFSCAGGTTFLDLTLFDIDLVTSSVSKVAGTHTQWLEADMMTNIPKVGRTRATLVNPDTYDSSINDLSYSGTTMLASGGAARLFPVDIGGGTLHYYAVMTAYPEVGWSVFFLDEIDILINGTSYQMPSGTVDLRNIEEDPRNKTFYIYATVEDSEGKYYISATRLQQSGGLLHVATVTTGENQILSIDRYTPLMIGDYEVSYDRKGGIIPVSVGFPQDEGDFIFLHDADLLP